MSEKITFRELVELIAEQSRQSRNSANNFIGELTRIIESGLEHSGSVSISGFGKFELRWMSERPGVNPRTGEEITIPGQNRVVFKPYKALREEVNRPYARLKPQVMKPNDGSEPKPSKKKITPVTGPIRLGPDPEQEPHIDTLIAETEPPKETKQIVFDPFAEDFHPPQPVENDQDSGSMTWTYGAAAVVLLLAILFILFMMQRQTDIADDLIATSDEPLPPAETEQPTIAPTDPELETEPEAEPELPITVTSVDAGQSLWSIAENLLGDPYLWPLIYSLNSSLIDDPNMVYAGSDIIIPEISDPENLTERQLNETAGGYLLLYEWSRENRPDDARSFLWAVGTFSMDVLESAEETADPDDWAFAMRR